MAPTASARLRIRPACISRSRIVQPPLRRADSGPAAGALLIGTSALQTGLEWEAYHAMRGWVPVSMVWSIEIRCMPLRWWASVRGIYREMNLPDKLASGMDPSLRRKESAAAGAPESSTPRDPSMRCACLGRTPSFRDRADWEHGTRRQR
ncbi:hypothetical protein FB451DRAFT_1182411 [Mycena latifolia]|nr:hypothetical protein FB451DRAFT_1182411 [Mycena latifolia]